MVRKNHKPVDLSTKVNIFLFFFFFFPLAKLGPQQEYEPRSGSADDRVARYRVGVGLT